MSSIILSGFLHQFTNLAINGRTIKIVHGVEHELADLAEKLQVEAEDVLSALRDAAVSFEHTVLGAFTAAEGGAGVGGSTPASLPTPEPVVEPAPLPLEPTADALHEPDALDGLAETIAPVEPQPDPEQAAELPQPEPEETDQPAPQPEPVETPAELPDPEQD